MKKSVLTSLIAASALMAGTAFAGNYAADAGYTAADTSSGAADSMSQGWYVGVGANRTAQNNVKQDNIDYTADTQKTGFGVLVGKSLSDLFAVEFGYNSYGTNSYEANNTTTLNYYGMHSVTAMGVINSPSLDGLTAHLKAGAAYFGENWKNEATGASGSYSGANPAFGFGLQYNIDNFGISLDWTRIAVTSGNSATSNDFNDVYAPDQYSLTFLYNIG